MKLLKRMAVLSLCVLALSGCTQSSFERQESQAVAVGPGGAVIEEDEGPVERAPLVEEDALPETLFEWEQVDSDADYMFNDPDFYEQGVSMTYEVDEEAMAFKLMWVLKDGTTEDVALEYATELVRKFNDILAVQKSEYDMAPMDGFGNVWDAFALTVEVSTENGTMMVEKSYKAGDAIDLPLPQYTEGGPQAGTEPVISPADKNK